MYVLVFVSTDTSRNQHVNTNATNERSPTGYNSYTITGAINIKTAQPVRNKVVNRRNMFSGLQPTMIEILIIVSFDLLSVVTRS
jgi:hypothetical protein